MVSYKRAYGVTAKEANESGLVCFRGHLGPWANRKGRVGYTRVCTTCEQAWSRKKNYGLSEEVYQQMIKNQEGRCAACHSSEKLVMDHDHLSGIVRGLLCNGCNFAAGFVESGRVERVMAYLTAFQKMATRGRKRAK